MDTNDSDKIFREKLGRYAAEPDPHVWERIRHSLNKKERRRLAPLWWPLGGAVAALLLGLWLTGTFSGPAPDVSPVTETESGPAVVPSGESPRTGAESDNAVPGEGGRHAEESVNEGPPTPSGSLASPSGTSPLKPGALQVADAGRQGVNPTPTDLPQTGAEAQRPTDAETTGIDGRAGQVAQRAPVDPENPAGRSDEIASKNAAGDDTTKTLDSQNIPVAETEMAASGKKSLFDVLEEQESAQAQAEAKGRWSLGPSIAPVYYNSFGNGSPIAPSFMENSKSGTVNLSYGLTVAYAVTDRLSLRSGIHKVDFGYNTNQVSFTSTVAVRPSSLIRTISYSENSKNVVVHSSLSTAGAVRPEGAALDVTAPSPQREGRMLQQFGYLEVPFELQYNLFDRQWGLNLIGGLSSLFLIDNSVSLDSGGTSTEIGEASNMNALNFSTNLGMGVYYRLTPRWQLQLQPMVKLHLNTFNDTAGSFRPYTVGVYSGMSFRF